MVAPTRRTLIIGALLLLIALVVAVMSYRQQTTLPAREDAFPNGKLYVGVDASFPPFAWDDGTRMRGADIDLAVALAQEMDVAVQFVPISYDGLYDALRVGRVDVVISALLPNPARTQDVRYTRPYFDNGLLLVSSTESAVVDSDVLDNARLAFEYGSPAHTQSRQWQRADDAPAFIPRPYELPTYALDAVRLSEADAALVDTTTYRLYQNAHPQWQTHTERVTSAPYVAAVRHDRAATHAWIDAALGSLQYDGRLGKILAKWL